MRVGKIADIIQHYAINHSTKKPKGVKMIEKQRTKTTQQNPSNESFSGYGLALDLAKKMRQQGQQMQTKANTKQDVVKSKEVKK